MTAVAEPTATLAPWAVLVLKDGVTLGGLGWPQQQEALALVWSALHIDGVLSEPQINAALKDVLMHAAVWLDTDHVELRRWLVDAGWLQRDGFGGEYRRPALDALPAERQAVAQAFVGIDTTAWVAAQRAAHSALRATRRREWQARQAAA